MLETADQGGELTFQSFLVTHQILISLIIISFIIWLVVAPFLPGLFYDPFEAWLFTDDVFGAVMESWPVFFYGVCITLVMFAFPHKYVHDKEVVFLQDIYKSVMAGILEEVGYRCMFILMAILALFILDSIFFGAVMWVFENITFFIVDLMTFGLIRRYIYGLPAIFVAGALIANLRFRDGHSYQGAIGMIQSWYMGLYLLVVMVTQGLAIAILVHMIYDLIISVMAYGRNVLIGQN